MRTLRRKREYIPALVSITTFGLSACILPDYDIVPVGEFNESPVRIVEPTYLSTEARAAVCSNTQDPEDDCVNAPSIEQPPHFLNPIEYPFCICSNSERRDPRRLSQFFVYVEDADSDEIFAALLLDSRGSQSTEPFWEYFIDYLDPSRPIPGTAFLPTDLSLTPLADTRAIGKLRQVNVGDDTGLDLCNAHRRVPLSEGWHTLTILVTDRPWFGTSTEAGPQYAVPDIASGATYARTEYSFYCQSEATGEAGGCSCVSGDQRQ